MKQIILTGLLSVLACMSPLIAQQTLSGTVTDKSGAALAGATVQAKGANSGTTTGVDGTFTLQLPDGAAVLTISYIGYQTLEVPVDGRRSIDIILTESAAALNEVVVTGYSEVSARKLISSVAVVKSDKLENVPVTDINKILQGNAPGVYSTAISGQPGSTSAVRIRGMGSVSASKDPLYVIDGVIVISGNGSELETGYTQSELLAQLNPNDIENITVLKDASATALYGARGSNGVIVITTKRGKAGKTEVTARVQTGINMPSFGNIKMMTAEQEWNYERAILANSGKTPGELIPSGRHPCSTTPPTGRTRRSTTAPRTTWKYKPAAGTKKPGSLLPAGTTIKKARCSALRSTAFPCAAISITLPPKN